MTRAYVYRPSRYSVVHFVYGLVNALVFGVSSALGLVMALTFFLYEFSQWVRYRDLPCEELAEYGAGLWAGAVLILWALA